MDDVVATIIFYLLFMNCFAFLLMFMDKRRAKRKQWRIAEKVLLGIGMLGGSIGGWLGMKCFHHKTKKWYFAWGYPTMIVMHVIIALILFSNQL